MKLPLSPQLAWLLAMVASCGPSAAKLKTAQDARYRADPATLYAAVKAVTESSYKISSSEEGPLMLRTEARWYTPEGQVDTSRGNNIARLQDNSINFSVIVRLVKRDADSYTVNVEPVALRLHGLTSKAEPLDMKDPSVPGWVHGKVESLQLAIHDRLKEYAVTGATVPAMVPPPATPPPAAGSAAGSAAPESAPAAPTPAP
jgi:hypothetical protein